MGGVVPPLEPLLVIGAFCMVRSWEPGGSCSVVTSSDLDAAVVSLAVARGRVDSALTEATGLARRLTALGQNTGWWIGPQGDDVRGVLSTTAGAGTRAWHPLSAIGTQLTALQTTAESLAQRLRTLESERLQLAFAPRPLLPTLPLFGPTPDQRRAAIDTQIEDLALEWNTACRTANDGLFTASAVVDALMPTDEPLVLAGMQLPPPAVLDVLLATGRGEISPAEDPGAVATWWDSLTAPEQELWLAAHPDLLGNTNGIPFETRYQANRTVMQSVLDGLEPGEPEWDKITPFLVNGQIDPNAQIVFFDFAGDGRVAQVFGDLETAPHVAFVVPGMGSTMANFGTVRGDAMALQDETGGAVIAWTGYDAPAGLSMDTVTSDPLSLLEVASDSQARQGGRDLAAFIAATQLETDADTTLIAHSYGSLTAGHALMNGAKVTNVVFIGSPGVGVDHVDEFPDGAAERFFVGEINGDPVATLERFGDAPTDPDFGAIRIDSGSSDALNLFDRHSEYFDDGIGLDNLAVIVEGGDPTTKAPTLIEQILEVKEDLDGVRNDAIDGGQSVIDFLQDIPTPLNPLGPLNPLNDLDNMIIDGGQSFLNGIDSFVDPLAENAANFTGSLAEDARDFAIDRVEDGKEFVDDRIEDGKELLEDGKEFVGDRVDDLRKLDPRKWL